MDLVSSMLALWLALSLRLSTVDQPTYDELQIFCGVACLTVITNLCIGLYRAMVRRAGDALQFRLLRAAVLSGLIVVGVDYLDYGADLPRSTFVIYTFIYFAFMTVTRTIWKAISPIIESNTNTTNVIIYGAGVAGQQLLEVLRQNNRYRPVAFVDNAKALHGIEISGLRVFTPKDINKLALTEFEGPIQVLLAIPSATSEKRRSLIAELTEAGHQVKSIPGMDELIMGKSIGQLTDVQPNDVLSRQSVAPDFDLMRNFVEGKTLLITGAGGSIGSEICRQLIQLAPKRLILLDNSEPALYDIDQSLNYIQTAVEIEAVLGSVLDKSLVNELLSAHTIDVVFHAAAYKHVPIVEANPIEGARVNILGTHTVATAAQNSGVSNFVLVSTDKAVRPTNIMGATKRAAETIIQNFQSQPGNTVFSMVRFGNVIGSSGSVVPKFLSQIEKGGPITITHPEITRYFMTIPEASQLVIQTGAMAQGGEVFLLDMGEPVKIIDLATKLVELSGSYITNKDGENGIKIEYTGLRPGEKLFEELLIDEENSSTTTHSKIYKAREPQLQSEKIDSFIKKILEACESRSIFLVTTSLRSHVP
ncbi:MAG: nucleoside-diphosphate sugar epimerase/dehydratase, partial [Pseudomonadota bacterium]